MDETSSSSTTLSQIRQIAESGSGAGRVMRVWRDRSQNRIQYVHLLARRGREPAAAQTDQCSAFQYKQYY